MISPGLDIQQQIIHEIKTWVSWILGGFSIPIKSSCAQKEAVAAPMETQTPDFTCKTRQKSGEEDAERWVTFSLGLEGVKLAFNLGSFQTLDLNGPTCFVCFFIDPSSPTKGIIGTSQRCIWGSVAIKPTPWWTKVRAGHGPKGRNAEGLGESA